MPLSLAFWTTSTPLGGPASLGRLYEPSGVDIFAESMTFVIRGAVGGKFVPLKEHLSKYLGRYDSQRESLTNEGTYVLSAATASSNSDEMCAHKAPYAHRHIPRNFHTTSRFPPWCLGTSGF